jgi:pimeloyl-ACP methyl ester carboxylesterase
LWAAAAAACVLSIPSVASASDFSPCPGATTRECATVTVPLDRAGRFPGTLDLHVEREEAKPSKGTILILGGGPGEASAQFFPLFSLIGRELFPGYTLVAADMRGTGDSGPLACSALDDSDAQTYAEYAEDVHACAEQLGPSRAAYTTREAAEDIEAIRVALGAERIGLWGTSYGTKLAMAYALAHPEGVDRLVLDSVLATDGPDVFGRSTLRAIPSVLASICAGSLCREASAKPAADFVRLGSQLARRPIVGRLSARGPRVTVTAGDLMGILELSDLWPEIRALLPAAVSSAVAGDTRALLRLMNGVIGPTGYGDPFNNVLFFATTCEDAAYPWTRGLAPELQGQALVDAAAAIPASEYAPFGSWALLTSAVPELCRGWPQDPFVPSLGAQALPDIPVLALAGDVDLRTPVSDSVAAARRFPRGHALVVPGVGHGVLFSDESGCALRELHRWLDGATPRATCPRVAPDFVPTPRPPRSLAGLRPIGTAGKPGRTLAAVVKTLADASAASTLARNVPGLGGGTVSRTSRRLVFRRYSFVSGVWVSGVLEELEDGDGYTGLLVVGGPAAARGSVTVSGSAVAAALAGKQIVTTLPR